MFIKRKIYPALKKHLTVRQVTVITGMRRSGKTTLARQLLTDCGSKNQFFLDFQRLDVRDLFSERNYDNIVSFLADKGLDFKNKVFIGLDEMQLMPAAAGVVKYLYDNYNIKFIITGSSSFYLKNLFSESLAGRKKIFELFPLDFGEFLVFKGVKFMARAWEKSVFNRLYYTRLKSFYEEYIRFGGFPEVVLAKDTEQKIDLLEDVISSFINIDIKALIDFRDSRAIYHLIKLLAARIGNKIDYNKLGSLSGLSRHTVRDYMDLFEKSYLLKRLSVLANRPDREIVKAQKLYFYDNGVANILADLDSGAKFENAVFTQLHHFGGLRYFSLKNGREIDFILKKTMAFEIKETPLATDLSNLQQLAKQAGIKQTRLIGRLPSPKFTDYIWAGEIK